MHQIITRMCQRWEGTQTAQTTEEKPAGQADADDAVQAVKQLEQDPSGHGWVLTKHKYSQQELKQPEVSSSWRQLTDILLTARQHSAFRRLPHVYWLILHSGGESSNCCRTNWFVHSCFLPLTTTLWMTSIKTYAAPHLQGTVQKQFSTCCFHWQL